MAQALVQLVDDTDNNGDVAFAITFLGNVTAGSLIVVVLSWADNSGVPVDGVSVVSLVDSLGQSYVQAGGNISMPAVLPTYTNYGMGSLWYFQNSKAGPCTITATFSSGTDINIGALEYSGMATSNVLRNAPAGTSGLSVSGAGPMVTAVAGDLIVAPHYRVGPGAPLTVALPFVQEDFSFGVSSIFLVDDLNASGNLAAAYNFAGNTYQWGALGASFVPLGGTPPTSSGSYLPIMGCGH